jgi:hypothetical protein
VTAKQIGRIRGKVRRGELKEGGEGEDDEEDQIGRCSFGSG